MGIVEGRRQRVVVVFTGGTISSISDPVAGGAVPALTGPEILSRSPDLDGFAEVVAIDHSRRPSSHFSFADLFDIRSSIARLLENRDVDGIVLVQGTDTIEESSFFLDLLYSGRKPVVVTGSMRPADAPDFDGPRNLRDAVLCASSPALEGQGVLVVLAGTIEAADDVVKTHSTAPDTFRSPNLGRVGHICGDSVVVDRRRGGRRHLESSEAAEPILLIKAAVGVDGQTVEALRAMEPCGLVVEATGSGNTHPGLLQACSGMMRDGVPVVLTTRASAGRITADYAFPGGGGTWLRAGALRAGYLSALKARVALALGLGAGLRGTGLATLLADPESEMTGS